MELSALLKSSLKHVGSGFCLSLRNGAGRKAWVQKEQKPLDVLGLAPYGEAIKIGVEKSLETAQQILYDICRPAAAEVGLLLRDQFRVFRAKNIAKIANKLPEFVSISADGIQLKAPPRLIAEVIESGSWCEDEQLQNMWAGLIAASCTTEGRDETNLLFTDLL